MPAWCLQGTVPLWRQQGGQGARVAAHLSLESKVNIPGASLENVYQVKSENLLCSYRIRCPGNGGGKILSFS